MQTVYPSSNHAHHAHNNCVHRNIYQLHYDFKDLIYMRKIASTLETTLGLGYGYTRSLIRFVPCVGKIHACNQENDISAVLSCFLVHILWGVTISKTRKLFEKHTSSATGESEEQGALPWCQHYAFPLQPWTALARFVNRGFVNSLPHFFFSTPPDTQLACFLLLALELLYPANALRVFWWITVWKLFSTQKVCDGKIHFWEKITQPPPPTNYFSPLLFKALLLHTLYLPRTSFFLIFCILKIKKEPKILHLFSQNCFVGWIKCCKCFTVPSNRTNLGGIMPSRCQLCCS